MSNAFANEFDAVAHAAFLDSGLADECTYKAQPGATAVDANPQALTADRHVPLGDRHFCSTYVPGAGPVATKPSAPSTFSAAMYSSTVPNSACGAPRPDWPAPVSSVAW